MLRDRELDSSARVCRHQWEKNRFYLSDAPTCYQIVSALRKHINIAILDPYMSREKSGKEISLAATRNLGSD